MRARSAHGLLARVGAILVAAGILVGVDASAAYASGSYPTLAASNIRAGTSTSTAVLRTVPEGSVVTIDCYDSGQNIDGTTIWDHLSSGGYISDALVFTGSNSPVVPSCAALAAANAQAAAFARDWVAANWASDNYTAPVGQAVFWPDDCTYFVSTALRESGLPVTTQWTDYTTDPSLVASRNFANPGPTKAFTAAQNFVDYMTESGNAIEKSVSWGDNTAGNAVPGDVIAYDWNGDGQIDHLAIVVSLNSSGYPDVVQESPSQKRFWSWSPEGSNWIQVVHPNSKVYLIHFTK